MYHSDQSPLSGYKAWRGGQPDNGYGGQDCVYVWLPADPHWAEKMPWDDTACGTGLAYVCECT